MSAAYALICAKSWVVSRRSSGAINCRVPFIVDAVSRLSSIRFVMPKSAILIHHGSGGWDLIRIFYIMFLLDTTMKAGNLGNERLALNPYEQIYCHA